MTRKQKHKMKKSVKTNKGKESDKITGETSLFLKTLSSQSCKGCQFVNWQPGEWFIGEDGC